MRRATVHFYSEWAHEIEACTFEGNTWGDAFGRKNVHLLFHWFRERFLARDAGCQRRFDFLEALEDPEALAQLCKDVFWTGVTFVSMALSNEVADVCVFSWKNGGKFGSVVDGRVDESAADADGARCVDERVEEANFRFLHREFPSAVWLVDGILAQILDLFVEMLVLNGADEIILGLIHIGVCDRGGSLVVGGHGASPSSRCGELAPLFDEFGKVSDAEDFPPPSIDGIGQANKGGHRSRDRRFDDRRGFDGVRRRRGDG